MRDENRGCLWLFIGSMVVMAFMVWVLSKAVIVAMAGTSTEWMSPGATAEETGQAESDVNQTVPAVPMDELITLPMHHMAGVNLEWLAALPEPEIAPQLQSLGVFKVTAYCACQQCCGKDPSDPWYGITATGTKATEGRTIAVDPRVIPYGSRVYIDGHEYTAEDCGGGIKENEIDVYISDHQRAREWGNQFWEVFILEED